MTDARDISRVTEGETVLYTCKSVDVCLWLFLEELREFAETQKVFIKPRFSVSPWQLWYVKY